MIKRFEIRYAPIVKPKLVVGVDYSTLKMPVDYDGDIKPIVAAAKSVTERVNQTVTYRGRFGWRGRKLEILMTPDRPSEVHEDLYFGFDVRNLTKVEA